MRIIGGKFKSRRYSTPKNFPSRPTTDFAKEGLFNILENKIYFDELSVLDLCAGSGSISFEFLSRGVSKVTAIDQNYNCIRHLNEVTDKLNCKESISIIKGDIIKFLIKTDASFDLIFADPPYDYKEHEQIAEIVFDRSLLTDNGMLIIEHGDKTSLEDRTHFQFMRIYGKVRFSFFYLNE